MNKLEVSMCLIDHEIDMLVSKKNLIDIRLTELYQRREDLVAEWEELNKPLVKDEKDMINQILNK